MKTLDDISREIAWINMTRQNEAMCSQLIEYEGRVPSYADISRLAMRFEFPDGSSEIRWRGKTILKVLPMRGSPIREIVKIPA